MFWRAERGMLQTRRGINQSVRGILVPGGGIDRWYRWMEATEKTKRTEETRRGILRLFIGCRLRRIRRVFGL